MPFIPDNTAQDTANLLQLVQMNRQRKRQQYQNILEMALPGQTAEDLGITPQQYKEATGNELKPGTVIKPETATDKLDKGVRTLLDNWKNDPSVIDKATPGSLDAIYTGRLAQILGLSGDMTGPAIKSAQQTAQTKGATAATAAATQSDLVSAGRDAWAAADAKTKGIAGQQLSTGLTTSGVQSAEANQVLDIAMKKQGLKMVSDPTNPAWAPIKNLGINPVMAVSAAATGMLPLLDQYAQMVTSASIARSQGESALSKANAEWAGKVSEATGGKIPPGVIMAVMNKRLAGQPPSSPQEKAVDALIDTATQAAYQATLTDAFMKGNPQARLLPELLKAATSNTNPDQFNMIKDRITTTMGEAIATQALGYPRPIAAGPERDAWDKAAAIYKVAAPDAKTWYQKIGDFGHIDIPGAMQTSTQTAPPPSGGGAPASAAPSAPGPTAPPSASTGITLPGPPVAAPAATARPKGPSITDLTPEQQAAVQQILGILVPPKPPGQ